MSLLSQGNGIAKVSGGRSTDHPPPPLRWGSALFEDRVDCTAIMSGIPIQPMAMVLVTHTHTHCNIITAAVQVHLNRTNLDP